MKQKREVRRKKYMDKSKFLTFSFDDGVTQDVRLIELFNKYGMKATFNLNSELLGMDEMIENTKPPAMLGV